MRAKADDVEADSARSEVAAAERAVPQRREPPRMLRSFRAPSATAVALAVLGASAALLLWSRLVELGVTFWNDEAYTALHYVDRGPRAILTSPYGPNNHLLFTLLAWVSIDRLGRYEVAYRLPSVVPGLIAVALGGWWTWQRLGRLAAVTLVALVTVSSVHLSLSVQARGYGLGFLAGAGVLVFAARASDTARPRDVVVFAAFMTVGMWTLPTFVLPSAAHTAILLARRATRKLTALAAAGAGLAALVFYAPHLRGAKSPSQQLTGSTAERDWLVAPFQHLARPSLRAVLAGPLGSDHVAAVAFVALVVLAVRGLWRRRDRTLLLHLTLPVVVTYAVLFATRAIVLARVGSFLLFHVLVLLAVGVVEVWRVVRRYPVPRAAFAGVAALGCVIGAAHLADQTASLATHPAQDLRLVGQIVRGSGFQRVLTNSRRPDVLEYYTGRPVGTAPPEKLRLPLCFGRAPYVFIEEHFRSAPPVDVGCVRRRGGTPIHVPQIIGSFDVWLVPAPAPGAGTGR